MSRRTTDDEDFRSCMKGMVVFVVFLCVVGLFMCGAFIAKNGLIETARIVGETVKTFREASGL